MIGHSDFVWLYGSHRLVELPTWDVQLTLDLGDDENAGTEC
jgi:hypothetical protein